MVDTTYFKSRMKLEMSIRNWIANQKFWTSVILLGLCVIVIFHIEGYVILIVEIVLSVVFIWMGTRRYKNWKIKNQEAVS